MSANSSWMCSVLKVRLSVSRSLAEVMAVVALSLVVSSRSSKVEPRSLSASIIESPAWPSASVMCSPFSVSVRVTRCATSLTLSDTRSPTEVMSCGEVEMHAGDGVAHLLGLVDQRLALVGQFAAAGRGCALRCRCRRARARTPRCAPALPVRRRAQARARRRRPWRRLRGGSPGRRSRSASRAFGFRLRQPHGHFRHRLGDDAQVLRAAHHVGEHDEENAPAPKRRQPARRPAAKPARGLAYSDCNSARNR